MDTLTEALFEVRFSERQSTIGDVLIRVLYERLREMGLSLEVEKTSFPELPEEVIDLNKELAYLPHKRIVLKDKKIYLQFAHRAVVLNNPKPYIGWEEFRNFIKLLLKTVYEFEIPQAIGRLSLRFDS